MVLSKREVRWRHAAGMVRRFERRPPKTAGIQERWLELELTLRGELQKEGKIV
jgi:hypothetical protein